MQSHPALLIAGGPPALRVGALSNHMQSAFCQMEAKATMSAALTLITNIMAEIHIVDYVFENRHIRPEIIERLDEYISLLAHICQEFIRNGSLTMKVQHHTSE